jgi:D-alanyl-lipoteichoic acid acyltransferase DltB (MBOAT superfamily)
MAIGSAGILGFRLNENFDTPYLAESIKEFWRRWHISLTSWFREYLYIPLGGSKKGKMRKQVNTMIVYLVSGLWHGAAWNYVMWGGINGFYNILEDVTCNFRKTCCLWLKIDSNSIGLKILKRIIVFIMVDFAWLFFRAEKISDIKLMLIKIINEFRLSWILHFEWAECFQTRYTLTITIFAILMLVATDIAKYYKVDLKGIIFKQQILIRWIIYFIIFLLIIYWGYYGNEYEKATFIYFQF